MENLFNEIGISFIGVTRIITLWLLLLIILFKSKEICLPGTGESSSQTIGIGTTTYAAPEQKENSRYTNKVI